MASSTPNEAAEAAQPHGAQEPDGALSHGAEAALGAEAVPLVAAGLAQGVRAAQGAAAVAVFRGELAASFARCESFSDCAKRRSRSIRESWACSLRLCPS